MSINEILILIITGIASGFISGSLGVGGGIIIIPALVFILGLSQHQAQGTSLALMLPPIGILAFINYYKENYVNVKYAIILAVFFLIGSYIGSLMAIQMPGKILKKAFGLLVIIAGIKMIIGK